MKRRGLNDLTNCTKAFQIYNPPANMGQSQPLNQPVVGKQKEKLKAVKKNKKKDFYFVNEYSHDIYMYLLNREEELFVDQDSVRFQDPCRRDELIMWFFTVANKSQISNDCLHLAIALFDRSCIKQVEQDDLFLTGVITLWIASKVEDSSPVSLKEILNQTHFVYEEEIKARCNKIEIDVLKALDFNVNIPTPIQFLRHFTKIAKTNEVCHQTAKFIVDLILTESRFVGLHYSLVAASAFCIAVDLVKRVPEMGDSWNSAIRRYSSFDKISLLPVMKEMLTVLVNTSKIMKQLIPLYKRYSKTVDSTHLSKDNIRNYQYKIPYFPNQ